MGHIGNLETHKLKGSFGYSAARLKDLGATEYTLVTIVTDRSGSVTSFVAELTQCLKEIVQACKFSPRADNLLIRIVQFGDTLEEIHGFKLLSEIKPDDYDNAIQIKGNTALYDASANAVEATVDYGRKLSDQDFQVNAIAFVLTDGCENASVMGINAVKDALKKAAKTEAMESLISILVAVNMDDPDVADALNRFHADAGFTQFVVLKDASAKTLAKLAQFVSKSISAQSQALGSGAPSQPLTI